MAIFWVALLRNTENAFLVIKVLSLLKTSILYDLYFDYLTYSKSNVRHVPIDSSTSTISCYGP